MSQNLVWLMSTTKLPCPFAAASARAGSRCGALVMSSSSGAVTTGTPTAPTGNVPLPLMVTFRAGEDGCAGRCQEA